MDKIFVLIIVLIVGFWGYLKYSEDAANWVATSDSGIIGEFSSCLLYTSPSPRDRG